MKNNFKIGLIYTVHQFKEVVIEANSLEEAEQKALDEAGNHEFSGESSSNYEIEYSVKTEGEDHDQ